MKQLQNNFTTPEQSRRLLLLGLPADSADMFIDGHRRLQFRNHPYEDDGFFLTHVECTPCWSVGQLIEIAIKCSTSGGGYLHLSFDEPLNDSETLVTRMVKELADVEFGWYDFSKLEE